MKKAYSKYKSKTLLIFNDRLAHTYFMDLLLDKLAKSEKT